MKAQLDMALTVAVAAVAKDPTPGPIKPIKRWRGEVVEDHGRRRIMVHGEDDKHAELARCPGAPARTAEYPDALPFVPNTILWWGQGPDSLVGTWVCVADTDIIAAAIVTESMERGWDPEQIMLMKKPFPQVMGLSRAAGTRLLVCQAHQVVLTEFGTD